MEGFWCGKQALVRSVDLKVLCNVTLRTVSGWEHSSTKQLERVPRGSFGGATCKYTVSVSIIDRNRAVLKKQMRQVSRLSLFCCLVGNRIGALPSTNCMSTLYLTACLSSGTIILSNQRKVTMLQEKIDRINFLSRKSKTVGLTDAEKQEQQKLRQEYIAEWRLGMNQVLDNTYIMDEKGNKKKLTPKN